MDEAGDPPFFGGCVRDGAPFGELIRPLRRHIAEGRL
jgi:hypothetical protein